MYALGLTGSIAMGKTTVLEMFASRGIPVFDSDAEVRTLLQTSSRLKRALKTNFPEAFVGEDVDRKRLAAIVFSDDFKLRTLENMVHPQIMRRIGTFLSQHRAKGAPLVVVDIPLLFETGSERVLDGVAVVSAPEVVQEKRALARPDMTKGRLGTVLSRQMPDAVKRARADFIISTGGTLRATKAEVDSLINRLKNT